MVEWGVGSILSPHICYISATASDDMITEVVELCFVTNVNWTVF